MITSVPASVSVMTSHVAPTADSMITRAAGSNPLTDPVSAAPRITISSLAPMSMFAGHASGTLSSSVSRMVINTV